VAAFAYRSSWTDRVESSVTFALKMVFGLQLYLQGAELQELHLVWMCRDHTMMVNKGVVLNRKQSMEHTYGRCVCMYGCSDVVACVQFVAVVTS